MLEQIVLLTGQTQQHLALSELLKAHNPRLTFQYAVNVDELRALDRASLRHARLLAFTTGVIVPPDILAAFGHGAYNFHPGSPEYPGWAPAHFALYDRATTFGATAHHMVESVDAGPIIGVETFVIPDQVDIRELEQIAYVRLAYLFWRLAKELATQPDPIAALPIAWNGKKSSRRAYLSSCDIPVDISKVELELRARSFHDAFRGIYPTIDLHGFKFQLVAPSPAYAHVLKPDAPVFKARPAVLTDSPSIAMSDG